MISSGGVAVCLLLSAHRAVIFAIAQLSCIYTVCTKRSLLVSVHVVCACDRCAADGSGVHEGDRNSGGCYRREL